MSETRDFWSRRRAKVALEAEQERKDEFKNQRLIQEQSECELSDDELCKKYELPALDDLNDPEAIKQFLKQGVPQRLKTLALRRLWRLNPVLANLDGLVDYGDDFANPPLIGDAVKTAYQVGKGMLKHIQALEEEARAEAQERSEEEVLILDETTAPQIGTEEPRCEPDTARHQIETDAPLKQVSDEQPEPSEPLEPLLSDPHFVPRRRRMAFSVSQERTV